MTAKEIYEIYQRGGKREYYEIAGCIIRYEDDEAVRLIQKYFNCDEMTAKEAIDLDRKDYDEHVRAEGRIPETKEQYLQGVALSNEMYRLECLAEQNKPKCPTCGSANIKPLSGLNRGASIAVFGIFSKKINKSFECKNCGYTW